MAVVTTTYDPTLQGLLSQVDGDWGDPVVNRANLVPYGIKPFDLALYGIDVVDGEFILIQGEEKNRKTTVTANILVNIMEYDRLKNKPPMSIDILESSLSPKKYRDTFISILATRDLFRQGHRYKTYCPVCNKPECDQFGISPKFLRFNTRTRVQKEAIEYALDTMNSWPMFIWGANINQGNTRNLREAVQGREARWLRLIEEHGVKVFVVDHVQQYAFQDEPTDYEKQIRAVAALSDVVSQQSVVCIALSQVSLTSVREVKQSGGKLIAAGGSKGAQEANTVFTVHYKSGSGMVKVSIEESRYAESFSIWQRLEDTSGSFYGEASTEPLQTY